MRIPLLILMATFAVTAVMAQQGPPRPRRDDPQALDAAAAAPWLMTLRTQRISQTLGVSDDKAKSIAQRWSVYDRDFLQRAHLMMQVRNQFYQILIGPGDEAD